MRLLTVGGVPIGPWRILMLAATLGLVVTRAESPTWGGLLAMHLGVGAVAAFLLRTREAETWLARGWLMAGDALLVGLALAALRNRPLVLLASFFVVVALAVLVPGRRRATAATLALGVAALALAPRVTGTPLDLGAIGPWPFLLLTFAIAHFTSLAARLEDSPSLPASPGSEVWAMQEITDVAGKSLDVSRVMRSVVHRVGDLVATDSCSILLADHTATNGFVVASKGHPDIDMLELDLAKYPEVRQALETRETVSIEDISSSPLLEPVREFLRQRGYHAVLVLPLVFGDEVLGALTLRSRRPFTADEVRFCKVAAGASASALKNALLFREMKQAAAQNRERGEKLRRLLDCSPDMIVATDTEGRVMEFNQGAESLTGWSASRAVEHRLADVLSTDLEPSLRDGDAPTDVAFRRADGGRVAISLVSAPLRGERNEEVGRVWIGRDVTKLRHVEKRLVQAERLSSLGEVVAGVAHELNNPLSGVVGYAELLRVNADAPEQIRDLDRIVESAIRCQKIVLKLLSFARQHPPEKRLQSVNECVRKVLDLKSYHLRASQVHTELDLDASLPDTCFDFHQIEQVVLNLLNNAEQAIPTEQRPGRIILRTRRDETDGSIVIDVEDNGHGVPDDVRDRVFDPFFTTKRLGDGTGLGLSVSYGIIEEHGGRIELVPGTELHGACFRIRLPVVDGPAVEVPRAEAESGEPNPLRDRRILVAEDEPLCLELFARLLRDEGAEVTLAKDGEEAWHELADADFDLIIVDVRMPNLSGQQLYEKVAENRPDLLRRFVFATGDLVRSDTLEFLEDLPNRILHKPLEMETVRRVLGQAVVAP